MKKMVCLAAAICLTAGIVSACGGKPSADGGTNAGKSGSAKNTTLTHLTWRVPDTGKGFEKVVGKYEADHPGVKIDVKNVASDQYSNTLKTRLLGGDPPDIMTLGPGTDYTEAARQGYLLDLTNDPMLANIQPSALEAAKVDGKVYGIPYDLVSLVVLYNKKIFKDNGLSVPTNYDEMIRLCETLKAKGIVPVAYGIKDNYVTQFLPYMIAPMAVYAKNSNWDRDLAAGKAKFNSPEWKRVFGVPFEFQQKGFLTPNALGVGDQQSVEMFARGEAAMTFTGTWATSVAKAANPDLQVGMFPFPGNRQGEDNWMNLSLGQILSVSAKSKSLEASKAYVQAWTATEYAQLWTDEAKTMPSVKGVKLAADPAVDELAPYLSKLKSWQFANVGWPAGVSDVYMKKFQEAFAGRATLDDVLHAMDEAATKAAAAAK
ncbi:ABC transporter substrate-binding protein [Paenibacillus flagellatus]|nr:extracellular solute-binding protein [Paenibacillus flagellatus]